MPRQDGKAVIGKTLAVGALALASAGCAAMAQSTSRDLADTTADAGLPRGSETQSAELLSAFFGLDNGLPQAANRICRGAAGQDGMPVIFSTEIDPATLQAGDFQVVRQSGAAGEMHCASFMPATDPGELRTVLLVGEFGDADNDPPVRVDITGHVHSIDGALDFQGASAAVTPLAPGPSLVMAEIVSDDAEDLGLGMRRTTGSPCPEEGVAQAVRVVWAGGVTLESGEEPGEAERDLYRVTVETSDGIPREVTPAALADLGDGDNNHVLCLSTTDRPVSVAFPAGVLTDPNNDLNPATTVAVTPTP